MMCSVARAPQIGDLFRLSIDTQRVGFGQVVGKYQGEAYYFAIFEQPHERGQLVDIDRVLSEDIALLALSFDALLHRGDWEIVGNRPPRDVKWPVYAESVAPGIFDAVDHTGTVRYRVDATEADSLPRRSVVAPIRVQNAFRALHGAVPWNEAFDRLRYSGHQA
jgi:hypothetical protein